MHHKRNREPAMSTPFYDLASLVVVPSGYKASKVYAQKPLTTDGQLTFSRASVATRVNASGLIEEVASNVPRLDYLGSTCGPKLNLEPQRSNLALWSEDFTNASWLKRSNIGITSNAIAAPDGTTTADKVAATDNNIVDYGVFDIVTSGLNTFSVFAKKGEMDYVFIGKDNSFDSDGVFFNLNTGAISQNLSGYSAKIENYGNGWYRCSVYFATNVSYFFISPSVNGTSFTFSGQSGNGIYIWGAQAEVGAYGTSYIKTTSAAVTRLADSCSKTGISSLIGQTEGTIFAEIYPEEFQGGSYIGISDGANISNRIIFGFEGGSANSGTLQVYGASGLNGSGTYTRGQRIKVAIGYKSGSSALYVNGNLIDSKTLTFTATFTKFGFDSYAGTQKFIGKCSQTLLFKTRLTNAQLAELTTL